MAERKGTTAAGWGYTLLILLMQLHVLPYSGPKYMLVSFHIQLIYSKVPEIINILMTSSNAYFDCLANFTRISFFTKVSIALLKVLLFYYMYPKLSNKELYKS